MQEFSRRQSLSFAAALGAVALLPRAAFAATAAEDAIQKFTGGRAPAAGKIALDIPEIAENGNMVPVGVKVDSPMTDASYVAEIIIVAEANPTPTAAALKLTPLAGKAEVATRIRLAKTQTVMALAKMNDGSVYIDKKTVKVTAGGCGG
jgi:sulfur-oxidizing protein SoxY